MKYNEFLKWLKNQGVEVKNSKKHLKLYYDEKISYMPRHPGKEIPTGTVEAIKKQLGLD